MMRAFISYYDEAQKAVANGAQWSKLAESTSDVKHSVSSAKFLNHQEVKKKVKKNLVNYYPLFLKGLPKLLNREVVCLLIILLL